MTRSDTWMPLYVADYLRDTMHLSRDEHGAYLLLIMAAWGAGGRLPNRPRALAAIAKASIAEWDEIAPSLLPFFQVEGDELVHRRVVEERAKAQRLSDARRETGLRGGRPKKTPESKPKPIGLANGNLEGSQTETPSPSHSPEGEIQPPSESELEANASLPDRPKPTPAVSRQAVEEIWLATPRIGRERSSRGDLTRALKAAAQRGHDPPTIAAALRRYYASPGATRDDCKAAKGVHRMVEVDRWQDWTGADVVPIRALAKSPVEQAEEDAKWAEYLERQMKKANDA